MQVPNSVDNTNRGTVEKNTSPKERYDTEKHSVFYPQHFIEGTYLQRFKKILL